MKSILCETFIKLAYQPYLKQVNIHKKSLFALVTKRSDQTIRLINLIKHSYKYFTKRLNKADRNSMSSQTNHYPQQQQQQQALSDERRRYCKIHPYAECVFLCTDPASTDSPFKCDLCFFEQNLIPKYLIPIKQIQRSDINTILWNWPLPDEDSLLQQVKAVTSQPRSDTDLRGTSSEYILRNSD